MLVDARRARHGHHHLLHVLHHRCRRRRVVLHCRRQREHRVLRVRRRRRREAKRGRASSRRRRRRRRRGGEGCRGGVRRRRAHIREHRRVLRLRARRVDSPVHAPRAETDVARVAGTRQRLRRRQRAVAPAQRHRPVAERRVRGSTRLRATRRVVHPRRRLVERRVATSFAPDTATGTDTVGGTVRTETRVGVGDDAASGAGAARAVHLLRLRAHEVLAHVPEHGVGARARESPALVADGVPLHARRLEDGQVQADLLENAGGLGERVDVLQAKQVPLERQHALGRLLDEVQDGQELAGGVWEEPVEHQHAVRGLHAPETRERRHRHAAMLARVLHHDHRLPRNLTEQKQVLSGGVHGRHEHVELGAARRRHGRRGGGGGGGRGIGPVAA